MAKIIFKGMRLIDGTGRKPAENATIYAEDGIIKQINPPADEGARSVTTVDLSGKTVIPGIIDCHVHFTFDATTRCLLNAASRTEAENAVEGVSNLKKLLSDGVVFFRDLGGKDGVDTVVRDAVKDGRLTGPDFLACGSIIAMTGGHCHMLARETDGTGDCVKAVREQVKKGADVIKFMATGGIHTPGNRLETAQLSFNELSAGIDEARRLGRKTAAHALTATGIKNAVAARVDSLEHGCFLDLPVITEMVDNGIYLVPTLGAVKWIADARLSDGFTYSMLEKAKVCVKKHAESFELAHKNGVKIAFGTDRGSSLNDHDKGTREMVLMAKHGMNAMDVIVSATKNAAELCGVNDVYGTLEPGKYANFIVYDKNPVDEPEAFTEIKAVYLKGETV